MNVKELLLIVFLVLGTTWLIEYFFLSKRTDEAGVIRSGQSFTAPKTPQETKPLNKEVDFIDTERLVPATRTTVKTRYAEFIFSTDGASLEKLTFHRTMDGREQSMTIIHPVAETEREKRCFLVALEEKTPYFYTLVHNKRIEQGTELLYQAETPNLTINKLFVVYDDQCKVDLNLTITPKTTLSYQPRVFFASPNMPTVEDDIKSAIVSDEKGTLTIIPRSKIDTQTYWFAPTLFGTDNRYFVTAMVDTAKGQAKQFTQRAYYALTGHNEITTILEGAVAQEAMTWNFSFYCGPKEEAELKAVDPRLEQTLGYAGWFAPIAHWLLKLLNFLYKYLGNYGLAIIALTILTKIVLLPFSLKGAESMKKQGDVQKKLKYLQQRYKDDPETLARERAELMRKEGLSSMGGCLPLLLQLPIFFALSRVLSTSIELYQAPFVGWITDLSARDPYYVLPLLTVLIMLVQAMTIDPKQRMQVAIMAIIFGAITINLAAGLVLYIFMSTLLGIMQTLVQQRMKTA